MTNMNNNQTAETILKFIQEEAMTLFPVFPEAFCLLSLKSVRLKDAVLSTDGESLFYDPDRVCNLFKHNSLKIRMMYLHTHLHAILGHCTETHKNPDDSACDNEVNHLLSLLTKESSGITSNRFLFSSDLESISDSHEKWHVHELSDQELHWTDAKVTGTLCLSKQYFCKHRNPLLNRESIKNKIIKSAKENEANRNGKRGSSSGRFEEDADLKKRDALDYTKFLRRFTIPREEAILDTDSFDYIPYHYGLTYYENLPFIEPLEYKEVNRLDELAIAIDTSGSCSGVIVRRFLEETWNILSQRENFFSKMRLHLIQCDCMVQEHRIFTSVEEWEEAVPNLQIHGHGDTDFQPVFTYLEKLIARGEIRQLRGLLFFTDGDGIFPPTAPSFDTAFIFLNHETEKHAIPDWGIRLNLNLTDVFEN